jgi:hypothetical protein
MISSKDMKDSILDRERKREKGERRRKEEATRSFPHYRGSGARGSASYRNKVLLPQALKHGAIPVQEIHKQQGGRREQKTKTKQTSRPQSISSPDFVSIKHCC